MFYKELSTGYHRTERRFRHMKGVGCSVRRSESGVQRLDIRVPTPDSVLATPDSFPCRKAPAISRTHTLWAQGGRCKFVYAKLS